MSVTKSWIKRICLHERGGKEENQCGKATEATLWQERMVSNCLCLWICVIGQNTKSDN